VVTDEDGRPRFELSGAVGEQAGALGADTVHLTLSHDGGLALAFVVLERR
jgi:holo-[acyl-carrier protein] synthase